MTEYDEIVMREKLQRLAGHGVDDDVAYENLLRNVRAAKRRRAAELIGGLGAVCVLGITMMSLRTEPERRLVPTGGNFDDVALVESTTVATTDAATTTATHAPTTTSTEPPTTTTVPETTTTEAATTVATVEQGQAGAPTGSPTPSTSNTTKGTSPSTGGTSGTTGPTATTTHAPAFVGSSTETKSATFGTITVTLANGKLSLVSKTPAVGATAEIRESGPEKINVRFTAPGGRSTITARANDGVILFEIENEAAGDDHPDVTIDDGDGKANGGTGSVPGTGGDGQDHSDRGDWSGWGSGTGGSDGDTPPTGTTPTPD